MYYIFLLASATLLVLFSLITFGRWYLGRKQKSKRPVDALAVKAYITHLLTTWNQEMLAHLKSLYCIFACETLCTAMRFYCIIATSSWETVSICIQFPSKYHKCAILDIDYDVYCVMYFLGLRISVQKGLTLYELKAKDH